ncbi:protein S100-A1-like [Morone saxatilis]|uniref:protein S100-A1-like n=1 Tax=Morone saxatilis TaxID=34816 RepID=UPI0015E22DAD|nr:protein S100-A1-like [Morone saxatilis]
MRLRVSIVRSSDIPRQLPKGTHHRKQKMSKLESAMETLIEVFKYHSSKDCNKFMLSKGELKNLLRGELNQYLEASKDPAKVNEIMCELDKNKDCAVSFEEFLVLVTKLTVCGAGFFQDYCTPVIITCCHR